VHELHTSWLNHPFWKTSFLVEDPADLAKLKSCGVSHVSIDLSRSIVSTEAEPKIVEDTPSVLVSGSYATKDITPGRKSMGEELTLAKELCTRSKHAVMSMFSEARMGNTVSVETIDEMVNEIDASVQRNPQALIALARLKTSDDYTYMHSVAVCAMMIALARELGMSEEQVKEAGQAGLMHDVGKMTVPDSILNKPGKLTDEEFAVIRSHPEKGTEVLVRAGGISPIVIDVCLHHHEKYDGSGYPHGLAMNNISRMARMGAVCDVYDAITSNRPYKIGWGPADSLQRMAQWKGHFDPVIFQAFIKTIGIYPTGSLVRLKSQRLAVVIEQDEKLLLKPVVKVFFSLRSNLPVPQSVLRLAAPGVDDAIEAREPFENWNFPYLNDLWKEGP
jgi:putative nucleotidyltransferase with HDIG domain